MCSIDQVRVLRLVRNTRRSSEYFLTRAPRRRASSGDDVRVCREVGDFETISELGNATRPWRRRVSSRSPSAPNSRRSSTCVRDLRRDFPERAFSDAHISKHALASQTSPHKLPPKYRRTPNSPLSLLRVSRAAARRLNRQSLPR